MRAYQLGHLNDRELKRGLAQAAARDGIATAVLLAHIAEFDARKLYVPAGYDSMSEYCIEELRLPEDPTFKRITAARTAREYPVIFSLIAEHRLTVTAVLLLRPHLTPVNARELIGAAIGKRTVATREWLAQRFPRTELLAMVEPVAAPASQECVGNVDSKSLAPERVNGTEKLPSRVEPSAPRRYELHVTIDAETRELLDSAQALLSHQVASGDRAAVLKRALQGLVSELERRKFATTSRPRAARTGENPRTIPARVRRAVRERDQGRCTFVSEGGHRCESRRRLEFDHVVPVARGGQATVEGLRLRCRAHNQLEAERIFGVEFMEEKREEARARAVAQQHRDDIVRGLRGLKVGADQARAAAEFSLTVAGTLEDQMKAASVPETQNANSSRQHGEQPLLVARRRR